jgi:hypothetical protein
MWSPAIHLLMPGPIRILRNAWLKGNLPWAPDRVQLLERELLWAALQAPAQDSFRVFLAEALFPALCAAEPWERQRGQLAGPFMELAEIQCIAIMLIAALPDAGTKLLAGGRWQIGSFLS